MPNAVSLAHRTNMLERGTPHVWYVEHRMWYVEHRMWYVEHHMWGTWAWNTTCGTWACERVGEWVGVGTRVAGICVCMHARSSCHVRCRVNTLASSCLCRAPHGVGLQQLQKRCAGATTLGPPPAKKVRTATRPTAAVFALDSPCVASICWCASHDIYSKYGVCYGLLCFCCDSCFTFG
jgi:hypothetical protein